MIKSLLLTFSILSFHLFLFGQKITGNEILGRPEDKSITVKAVFNDTVEARLSFGTASGIYCCQTACQKFYPDSVNESIVTIRAVNLMPGTKYYYRLQYRKPGDSLWTDRPEYSFHTARIPGDSFTFDIEADPHLDAVSDTALYRVCLQNQLADHPDFMIDLGDFLMSDKLDNAKKQVPEDTVPYRCRLLRSYYDQICHSIPLYNVLGNHEGEDGWLYTGTGKDVDVWDTRYRKKYFMNPLPDSFYSGDTTQYPFVGQRESYYSWTWGDALFIVLDPYWFTNPKPDSLNCWRWTLGKRQYDWLKSVLENSPSKFKFVFIHNLVGGNGSGEGRGGEETAGYYEWGGLNIDGTDGWNSHRPGWYKPIKDLLREHKATILFHGHDHFYGKQELNCLLYQEVPQPSLPQFKNVNQAAEYGYKNGIIIPNSGHLRVKVSPSGVTVDYIRAVRPSQETSKLHNRDISQTYFVNLDCYDSLTGEMGGYPGEYLNIITVYPNPATNELIIESGHPVNYCRNLFLVNMPGEVVLSGKIESNEKSTRLDIQNIPPGMYFIRLYDGLSSSSIKIIIPKR